MKLTADEVTQIARLARLRLTDKETEEYRQQLSEILGYVEQLSEVDTEGVEPTAQVSGQTNVLATDEVTNQPDPENLLKGAPEREGNQIKVRAVFE